ncbi:DUF726 domain-containing protein [Nocardioides sp. AE5]|uniref:DUF726 domain-containing protein n=1 Tax=Nocardioides sp. AE5 TaxID=2962573 RepID=UPI002881DDB5|nr:DUF726 domain-containing protein [Nocardioides sp. AE5]MDT0201646.1 DUF726 domain-containing protein [Nocardioides sp. AE5]
MTGSIHAHVVEGTRLRVAIESDQGATLALVGEVTSLEPTVEAGGVLQDNPALLSNMWAYAKTWYEAHATSQEEALGMADPQEQKTALKLVAEIKKAAQKRADSYAKAAQWIADVADDVSPYQPKEAWCSSCFFETEHRKSNRPAGQLPVYVCQGCGSPTLPCVAPSCENMAVRERGAVRVPQYCAEHRHDIPGFAKAHQQIGELYEYEEFLEYDKPNLSKASKLAAFGAASVTAAAPMALLAAPAIGGAIGSMGMFGGLSGAAATSHGLALLGGGSLAAGGLGMAGGTTVVTVVGGAVGGTLGASVSNAYLREDRSFRIELLRPGKGGVPVLVCNGFLTEGDTDSWGGWRAIVDSRYEDSPVYRVRWGSKELKNLGMFAGALAGNISGGLAVKGAAALATKEGAKWLGRTVAPALVASDLAKNPWHVAKSRADKTGVVVGDLLARTDTPSYVLMGHSLGARVMVVAAEALGSKPGGPRIEAAHLFGTAIGAKSNWDGLTAAIDDAAYGYHSRNDAVLKWIYKTVQAGQSAVGYVGFQPASAKLVNVDVSDQVPTHFDYLDHAELMGAT